MTVWEFYKNDIEATAELHRLFAIVEQPETRKNREEIRRAKWNILQACTLAAAELGMRELEAKYRPVEHTAGLCETAPGGVWE